MKHGGRVTFVVEVTNNPEDHRKVRAFVAKRFQEILCAHGPGSVHAPEVCQYCDKPVDDEVQDVYYSGSDTMDHLACVPASNKEF